MAVQNIYETLRTWRFDMMRLATLGVAPPDPSVQRNVLIHFVAKLSESNREFDDRLNAYRMNRNLQGAVTQPQVDELWRYLVAEAREFHNHTAKETGKKQKAANTAAASSKAPATPSACLLYTSPSPRDGLLSRMPSSA